MGKYLIRRLFQAVPLLFAISLVLFIITNSIGDPFATQMIQPRPPTAEQLETLRRQMGLDQPLYIQYIYWLFGNDWSLVDVDGDGDTDENMYGKRKGVIRGDFGLSLITRQPAMDRIEERFPNTLILMLPMYVIVISLALFLGIVSALKQYTVWDNILTTMAFVFYSMPIFFVALGMIYVFAVGFRELGLPHAPIAGMYDPTKPRNLANLIEHMILPVTTMTIISTAFYMRFVRSSILEAMNRDYVRTARAKGLRERRVFSLHVLKNAALPLVTLIGLDLPFLLGGAVVTESIFAWPGMGQLFIESLRQSDYTVLMGILMIIALAVVIFQILTDIVYSWIDPRVRLT